MDEIIDVTMLNATDCDAILGPCNFLVNKSVAPGRRGGGAGALILSGRSGIQPWLRHRWHMLESAAKTSELQACYLIHHLTPPFPDFLVAVTTKLT